MQDGLLALRGAEQATGTACSRLAFLAHHMAAAHRTGCWHNKRPGTRRPPLRQHADHFRNHVARAAHDHGIADMHVLAANLVFVMQGGIADRGAADEHRLQLGDRREFAGAPDLHFDVAHNGELLFRRKFVRHGPARLARDKAEFCLQCEAIDLVHHTVDVERQGVALGCNTTMKFHQSLRAMHDPALVIDRESPSLQLIQNTALCVVRNAQPCTSPRP